MEKGETIPKKTVVDFYDPAEKVKSTKAVTVRMVREENDKYRGLQSEEPFTIRCSEDGSEVGGVILAHWQIPLSLIPVELLTGEDYDLGSDEFSTKEDLEQRIRDITKEDLSTYYDIDEDTLLHVIVYGKEPLSINQYNSIQKIDESPEEWVERCADDVFEGIDGYEMLINLNVKADPLSS